MDFCKEDGELTHIQFYLFLKLFVDNNMNIKIEFTLHNVY